LKVLTIFRIVKQSRYVVLYLLVLYTIFVIHPSVTDLKFGPAISYACSNYRYTFRQSSLFLKMD